MEGTVWFVCECFDMNEGEDPMCKQVRAIYTGLRGKTYIISKHSRIAPIPMLISSAVIYLVYVTSEMFKSSGREKN